MKKHDAFGVGSILFLAAVCVLIFGMVRYNLSTASAAIAQMPTTIVIDAGHGGEDGGATGVTGASESQLNLEIALRLEQMMSFCGFQTLMVRTTDTAIYTGDCETFSEKKVSDLKNRAALVNRYKPAILFSIHQNHFPQEKYAGAQVFYARTDGSRDLALLAQSALVSALDPSNKRQCKPAETIYLLGKIQCPGILVECGFLSNSREEALLQEPEYQKKIVCAITGALTQYTTKGEQEREV